MAAKGQKFGGLRLFKQALLFGTIQYIGEATLGRPHKNAADFVLLEGVH